jgi:hypothetical protein
VASADVPDKSKMLRYHPSYNKSEFQWITNSTAVAVAQEELDFIESSGVLWVPAEEEVVLKLDKI